MPDVMTTAGMILGSVLGGYLGVRIAITKLEVGHAWMKEKLDDHIKDHDIHHTHHRDSDPTGIFHRVGGR